MIISATAEHKPPTSARAAAYRYRRLRVAPQTNAAARAPSVTANAPTQSAVEAKFAKFTWAREASMPSWTRGLNESSVVGNHCPAKRVMHVFAQSMDMWGAHIGHKKGSTGEARCDPFSPPPQCLPNGPCRRCMCSLNPWTSGASNLVTKKGSTGEATCRSFSRHAKVDSRLWKRNHLNKRNRT